MKNYTVIVKISRKSVILQPGNIGKSVILQV